MLHRRPRRHFPLGEMQVNEQIFCKKKKFAKRLQVKAKR